MKLFLKKTITSDTSRQYQNITHCRNFLDSNKTILQKKYFSQKNSCDTIQAKKTTIMKVSFKKTITNDISSEYQNITLFREKN